MPLINCKIEISLRWYENCALSTSGTAATFTITDTKPYVPIITLNIEDNTKLHWNKYKIIFKNYNDEYTRERLDASFRGVNKLFVLPYESRDRNVTDENSHRKYFLSRLKITNY